MCKYPRQAYIRFKVNILTATKKLIVKTTVTRKAAQCKAFTAPAEIQKEDTQGNPSIGHIVIPYTQGIGESFKTICRKYGIHAHFKGNMTLRQMLLKPKDQGPKGKKSGVIYSYKCGKIAHD